MPKFLDPGRTFTTFDIGTPNSSDGKDIRQRREKKSWSVKFFLRTYRNRDSGACAPRPAFLLNPLQARLDRTACPLSLTPSIA
jgi:hypothetical protein